MAAALPHLDNPTDIDLLTPASVAQVLTVPALVIHPVVVAIVTVVVAWCGCWPLPTRINRSSALRELNRISGSWRIGAMPAPIRHEVFSKAPWLFGGSAAMSGQRHEVSGQRDLLKTAECVDPFVLDNDLGRFAWLEVGQHGVIDRIPDLK